MNRITLLTGITVQPIKRHLESKGMRARTVKETKTRMLDDKDYVERLKTKCETMNTTQIAKSELICVSTISKHLKKLNLVPKNGNRKGISKDEHNHIMSLINDHSVYQIAKKTNIAVKSLERYFEENKIKYYANVTDIHPKKPKKDRLKITDNFKIADMIVRSRGFDNSASYINQLGAQTFRERIKPLIYKYKSGELKID